MAPQFGESLTAAARVGIYDRNMFIIQAICVNILKLFPPSTTEEQNKLEHFLCINIFQASSKFAAKGTYRVRYCKVLHLCKLFHFFQTSLKKRCFKYKHSSLFNPIISDEEKCFLRHCHQVSML